MHILDPPKGASLKYQVTSKKVIYLVISNKLKMFDELKLVQRCVKDETHQWCTVSVKKNGASIIWSYDFLTSSS